MRRLKRWLLPLLTLLLIAAGAGMPWAAARFQDRYGIAAQEVLPFDPVSLTLRKDSEIVDTLRLMGSLYEQAEWFGETNLDEADACMAALDALAALDRFGLLEEGDAVPDDYLEMDILDRLRTYGKSSAIPLLCVSEDGSSAIIWYCRWHGYALPSYELMIDDTTGLAVTCSTPCSYLDSQETDQMRIEQWVRFFRDYYSITITDVKDRGYGATPRYLFLFDPEDGQHGMGILLRIRSFDEVAFYPCSALEQLSPLSEDSFALFFLEQE